ncbi:MAG TPA: replication/maintenance protein RepL [Puia sp.]|nr:replication/maintenance protein RepL [Puia sp.]
MKKSFLKTGATQTTTIIDQKSGEVLHHGTQKLKYLANSKEEFFIFYSSLIGLIQGDMTGPEIKVYAYLLQRYLIGTEIALPKQLKQNMADFLHLKLGTVNNVLSTLTEKTLVFTNQRAIYKINPRYAFKGSTKERDRMLKGILEFECPDC